MQCIHFHHPQLAVSLINLGSRQPSYLPYDCDILSCSLTYYTLSPTPFAFITLNHNNREWLKSSLKNRPFRLEGFSSRGSVQSGDQKQTIEMEISCSLEMNICNYFQDYKATTRRHVALTFPAKTFSCLWKSPQLMSVYMLSPAIYRQLLSKNNINHDNLHV